MQPARTNPSFGTASQPFQYLALVVCLVIVYDVTARFGLTWATVHENISVIWPPSGILLAVFLRFGVRFWPGAFAGSLLANLATNVGAATAAGIAAGDTLEGLIAALLLGWTGFDQRLGRLPDILRLIVLGGMAAPCVAATGGATLLCLSGSAPWSNFGAMWTAWWLGDGLSIVVLAPFLLAWTGTRPSWPTWRDTLEAAAMGAVIVAACAYAFAGWGGASPHAAVAYATFPAVLFAAVRFGARGASASVLLATVLAVWAATARLGAGPVASPDALAALQVFVGSLAVSALALAAALAEREAALAALRHSETETAQTRTLLADAVDSLRDHFLLYDADDRLVLINKAAREWNPAFAAVTVPGVHISDVARAAVQTWRMVHPDVDVEELVRRRMTEHRNFDRIFEQKFGERWLRIREFPTSDGGVVVVRMDITEQKAQEAALTDTRNLLVTSIEALSDAFAIYDAEDRLVLCNSKYKEVYAVSADLLVPGTPFETIIREGARRGQYADAIGRVDAFVAERMAAHRNPKGALVQHLADGRWLRVAERRMPGGQTVGIRTDITELKTVIAALQESEAKASQAHALLVDAIESIDDGFLLWDAQDRLVLFNAAIRRMLPDQADFLSPGITFNALLERRVRSGRIIEAIGREDEFIRERIARHRAGAPPDAPEQHLDNGMWIRVHERRTRESGMAVVLTDITKLKEREIELVGTRSEAISASRTKSEFLAMMSHELRTPLNVVIGFAEILKAQGSMLTPAKVVDYAADIYEAGRYLLALLNDVLDLSKAEAGKMELQMGPVNVLDVVDRSLRMIKERATQRQITLVAEVEPGLPTIEADERKLMQILLNLLSNAVKFTPEGGQVTVTAACEGADRLAIQVIDTGIGIAAENIEKALTAFGQVNNLMTRDQAGTGLGLPLAKRLTELHGATLDLKSTVGAGTTVTLRFPVQPATSAAVA